MLISSIIIGLVFALRGWANATLSDFLIAVPMVFASLIFHIVIQKATALHLGFTVEYKFWLYGLAISLILSLVSQGRIWWIVFPGGIIFSMMARHRIGRFRYGMNYFPMGWIAFTGPLASVLFGTIFNFK